MKFCKDCRHYATPNFLQDCQHPNLGINLVTGENKRIMAHLVRIAPEKTEWESCGPEGAWFEPRPVAEKPSIFSKLFRIRT